MTDIFDFWAECPPDARQHPQDAPVFARAGDMGFDLRCLPSNVWGPLRTAKLVLLFLSPGFDESDVAYADKPSSHALFARRRQGIAALDGPSEHPAAWKWLRSRLRAFSRTPVELRDKVAILNIGAYHSKTFKDTHALMALPSSRAAIGWAQSVLFPEAERGERVVVCLRKSRAWGLRKGQIYPGTLYAPHVNAAGYMAKGPHRKAIIRAARKAMGLPHDEALMIESYHPSERFGWGDMSEIQPLNPDGTPMSAKDVEAMYAHHASKAAEGDPS